MNYEAPISTFDELVDFVLAEENDSDGFRYLRGLAELLRVNPPTTQQVGLCLHLLKDDPEVIKLVLGVAHHEQMTKEALTEALLHRLSTIYFVNQRNEK